MKAVRPLKHYRRRRFLHKFLMMDSPRSAHLMGAGLLCLALLFRMFAYLAVIRLVLVSGFGAASIASGLLLAAIYALLLGAAMLFIGGGKYEGIRRWRARDLLTVGHWKKCWNLLFAAGAVLLLLVRGETPLTLTAVLFLVVLAVVFAPDGRRIRKMAFIPVLLAFLVLAGMFCTARFLERDIRSRLVRLAGMIGRDAPVSTAEYDAREKNALSVKQEPLKTLAETEPEASFFVWYRSFDEMQKDLARLRRENPRYPPAVERFLALPVGSVREEIAPETGAYMCSCGLLRTAARFQALLIGCARDKKTVIRADAGLRKLAAWCISSHSAVARLVGISVEKIRLQALAGTLPRLNWTKEEYASLLGDAPDWDAVLLRAIGDETLQGLRLYAQTGVTSRSGGAWDLYTLLDMRHAVRRSERLAELVLQKDVPLSAKRGALLRLTAPRGFIFADMTGGMELTYLRHFERIRDIRIMAEAAFGVMEEFRQTGALPAHPRALAGLRDRCGDRPFGYEHGEIAVAKGVSKRGFLIFAAGPEKEKTPGGIAVFR